jgi:hypothetical protein
MPVVSLTDSVSVVGVHTDDHVDLIRCIRQANGVSNKFHPPNSQKRTTKWRWSRCTGTDGQSIAETGRALSGTKLGYLLATRTCATSENDLHLGRVINSCHL